MIRYQGFIFFTWKEHRLIVPKSARAGNYSSISLDPELQKRLWVPDVYIFGQEDFERGSLMRDIGQLDLLTNGYLRYGIL